MGQLTLSKLQKKQYKELVQLFQKGDLSIIEISDVQRVRMSEVLTLLEMLGYIREIQADGCNMFERIGNFKDFDAWHKDRVREERKLSRREWNIAIVSAVIGAIIGLIPTIISWIGGI